jgi:hypothetical protein
MNSVRSALTLAVLAGMVGVSTALAQQPARRPPQMLHPAAGKQDCLSCHARGANEHITGVPAAHTYGNGACAMCHKPIAATPKDIPHGVGDDRADCRKCHAQAAEGAAPAPAAPGAAPSPPASHAAFHVSTCRLCHQSAAAAPPKAPGSGRDDHDAL